MNYVSANKTKITGALLVAFGVLQTQSETIRALLDEASFAWFTIAVGMAVAVLGFLNSGGSITPPGESRGPSNTPPTLFIALLLCPLLLALAACAGTRTAYKAADTLEEYAYVVTEHYAGLLREATELRASGTLRGDALARVQAADNQVGPKVLALKPLVNAYLGVKNAETEQALQVAVDEAVRALADFVREIRGARAGPTGHLVEPPSPFLYAMVTA